jgi:hypothetical protein
MKKHDNDNVTTMIRTHPQDDRATPSRKTKTRAQRNQIMK